MKRYVLFSSIVATFCVGALACGPRGESKSLNEVVERAQAKFFESAARFDNPGVNENLKSVSRLLDESAKSDGVRDGNRCRRISQLLSDLVGAAGYTSRPAFGEIIHQWNELAERGGDEKGTLETQRLLSGRTFSLLTSELEGGKFSQLEREKKKVG
jgi:hypothetical protein